MSGMITVENDIILLRREVSARIADWEKKIAQIKAAEEAMKEAIKAEMEEKGILKIDTPELVISYIGPTDRETLDSKAMRKDFPRLYDQYVKMTPVKASIRVKIKEGA